MKLASLHSPRRVLSAAVAMLGALAASAAQCATPTPFSARYEVLIDGKRAGEASLELQAEGTRWRHSLRAIGTRGLARLAGFTTDQSSLLDWPGERPRLLGAHMRSESLLRDREASVSFDWTQGMLTWSGDISDGEPRSRPIEGTPATGSSLNLQLALEVESRQPGDVVPFVMHDRG